jgi:hypothetical protein
VGAGDREPERSSEGFAAGLGFEDPRCSFLCADTVSLVRGIRLELRLLVERAEEEELRPVLEETAEFDRALDRPRSSGIRVKFLPFESEGDVPSLEAARPPVGSSVAAARLRDSVRAAGPVRPSIRLSLSERELRRIAESSVVLTSG